MKIQKNKTVNNIVKELTVRNTILVNWTNT